VRIGVDMVEIDGLARLVENLEFLPNKRSVGRSLSSPSPLNNISTPILTLASPLVRNSRPAGFVWKLFGSYFFGAAHPVPRRPWCVPMNSSAWPFPLV